MISVLCRWLKYDAATFHSMAQLPVAQVKNWVAEREKLTAEKRHELFQAVRLILKDLEAYTIVHPLHDAYPVRFQAIANAPSFLCTHGDLGFLKERLLTVIGSRRTLLPFTDWMNDQYVQFLKNNDVVTVSGGAYGIDVLATRLALFCDRPSVLILPSGLARCYPQHVNRWKSHKKILMITEYFPLETVRNYHFVHRNRLLGAISDKTLVVQCAPRSGTMTTVQYALDCGADILVVPSFPGAMESSGNIQLLKQGAQMVTGSEDLDLCFGVLAPHPDRKDQEQQIGHPQS